ncbi:outer membrane beta-barrel protein [Helicobacter sp. MIT 21-1697]|uniref:outer membrane beta-barrel protein n=1 Tax=Helicobacter sp. MIT 21-1697 TaxID=2993733 RepID=UPI00224B3AB4|nr:outer membrane beta-barrel protein [Helicobacter sp. MIT 21-1697]MCX2717197.1 outer membrane beta-barrel protein [Helicobacter sp. MIT 21-1697]
MKTIKKCVLSSAVALALASSALVAEEDGVFVGVGVGYGGSQLKTGSEKTNLSGISYEIIAGYKQFFSPSFGLRYYANFAYADASKKAKAGEEKIKGNVMDYGVNVDALYNFVTGSTDVGAFLGLGLGANTWGGKTFKDGKLDKTGLNLALNVGLRSVIAQNHGVEIAARVPFIATTLQKAATDEPKITGSHTYNVGVRYVFNF